MSLYRDEAVVLRTWKLGEADRIVSLHTRTFGKVRGVAKGIRRTKSKFGARLEPAALVSVQLYRGRGDLDTVTQAATIQRFTRLRDDPERFARASAMLEAVDSVSPEREPDNERFTMLARALLTVNQNANPLVLAGFFLKLLAHEGVGLEVDGCVGCGADTQIDFVDTRQGGVFCRQCRRGRPLSQEALTLMRMMLGGALGQALHRPIDTAGQEVHAVAVDAMQAHLERRLRSISVMGHT